MGQKQLWTYYGKQNSRSSAAAQIKPPNRPAELMSVLQNDQSVYLVLSDEAMWYRFSLSLWASAINFKQKYISCSRLTDRDRDENLTTSTITCSSWSPSTHSDADGSHQTCAQICPLGLDIHLTLLIISTIDSDVDIPSNLHSLQKTNKKISHKARVFSLKMKENEWMMWL